MLLDILGLMLMGVAVAYEVDQVAYVGSNHWFSFNARTAPTNNSCSVTFGNGVIFYVSDWSYTIESEYLTRLVNVTFDTANNLYFSLLNLSEADNGEYRYICNGSTLALITLTVIYPISEVEVKQLSSHPPIVGRNYSLECNVVPANSIFKISWKFSNATHIAENDVFEFEGNVSQVLVIKDVKQSHFNAQIVCSATDVLKQTINSSIYAMVVVVSPEIQDTENNLQAALGRPFFKDCYAKGYPYPVVQWYLNKKIAPQIHISSLHSVLVIRNVTSANHVNYTCTAKLSLEKFVLTSDKIFTLHPYGPPNPPVKVSVIPLSDHSAEMKWIPGDGQIQTFVTVYYVINTVTLHHMTSISMVNGTYYQKLENLVANSEYEAYVFAKNSAGDSRRVYIRFNSSGFHSPEHLFFDGSDYNYVMFAITTFGAAVTILLLGFSISTTCKKGEIARSDSKDAIEAAQQGTFLETKEKKGDQSGHVSKEEILTEDSRQCSPVEEKKKEQAPSSLYEVISEKDSMKNIPEIPNKKANVSKISNEASLSSVNTTDGRCVPTAERKTKKLPETPQEYSSLREKSIGPSFYEEISVAPNKRKQATFIVHGIYANTVINGSETERL